MTCYRKYEFKQKFVAGTETPIIDLYAKNDQNKRRYQMIVVNSLTKYRNKPFAAFIVPKSRFEINVIEFGFTYSFFCDIEILIGFIQPLLVDNKLFLMLNIQQ